MKTNSRRPLRGLSCIALAALVAATCRSYEAETPDTANSGGTSAGGSTVGGDAGEPGNDDGGSSGTKATEGGSGHSGDGGRSGDSGYGGRSGSVTGGFSGTTGTDAGTPGNGEIGGESGGGAGGESGGGSGPTAPPLPGTDGAVRILVDGAPRCGGTLLTNEWILTADQCLHESEGPDSLSVGFGMDATNFHQVRKIVEVQRYPGNDGTEANRGRDLLLFGVAPPFEIDGRTAGYERQLWPFGPDISYGTQRCVGWDMIVDANSPTNRLHAENLGAFAVDLDTHSGSRPSGHRIWWLNASADPSEGVLPVSADLGIGCFVNEHLTTFLTSVYSTTPERRRNGTLNDGREAFSVGFGDFEVSSWLDRMMFGGQELDITLSGGAGVCSWRRGRVELFGLQADGRIARWTRNGNWERRPSVEPPTAVNLTSDPLGVLCTPAGGIELFGVGLDGAIWWQSMSPDGTWDSDWERVPDPTTAVTSGIAVVGVLPESFHLFVRGEWGELRRAEYDHGWTGQWHDLGGSFVGTPSARMPQLGRIDVFVRNEYGDLGQMWTAADTWQPWAVWGASITSDPLVIDWTYERLHLLQRSALGTLIRTPLQGYWQPATDTLIEMPEGTTAGAAEVLGRLDVFVTPFGGGRVWNAQWPRAPR